ncbi:MAG: Queuine tRNA-ribosyltransferase [candidate division WS6 bacterium GW2011_WS6_36_26]|nr:MAG: Queuine tRNA-ribosyltransferase [candidate division WS6 bacterium GW2011_WS6_36_26]
MLGMGLCILLILSLRITNQDYVIDERPIDSKCDCYTCKNHSRAYVHQMLKVGEATGMTLRYYQRLVDDLNAGNE